MLHLKELFKKVDNESVNLENVEQLLSDFSLDVTMFDEYKNETDEYLRIPIYEGNFSVYVMKWPKNGKSTIHEHKNISGIIKILRGQIQESSFVFDEVEKKLILKEKIAYSEGMQRVYRAVAEKIDLVNAERVVIIGREESATQKFRKRIELAQKGNPEKGPKYPRMPDKIVKLSIRGMLPFKKSRGRKAFENLKTHIGVPKELEKENMETVEEAKKDLERQYIRMAKLSRQLGARWH